MNQQKKILYLSWIIPPAKGGSAYIAHQLSKQFSHQEWIIAGGTKKPFTGINEYDGIRYHYFFTELNWFGHGDRYFSLLRWLLFPVFLFQLYRLCLREKIHTIISVFPDGYYLSASLMVANFFNLKYYSYFHNTYVENRKGISKWFAGKIQKLVFRKSQKIFVMSEGMNEYYYKQYPDFKNKFSVLPHTFDQYPVLKTSLESLAERSLYKLVLIGTFNHSNMEATRRLLSWFSRHRSGFQVDIYSSTKKSILKLKWALDLDDMGIFHKGFVRQEEVLDILSSYDACLITHGFFGGYTEVEYRTIFPTRMIPLLLSGKPILAHSPDGSYFNTFIKKYDCAELVADTDEASIKKALDSLTNKTHRREELITNAKKAVSNFYGPDIATSLKMELDSASKSV